MSSETMVNAAGVARYEDGLALYQRGDLTEAESCLTAVTRRQTKDHHFALYMLAVIARDTGRPAIAVARLREAIAHNGTIADFHAALANILQGQGRHAEAIAAFDGTVALRSDDVAAFVNRGNALGNLKRHAEAIESYDRALQLDPGQATAHNNRANTLRDMGRLEESLAGCDRAIGLRPDFAMAHLNRGNALGGLRRYDEAIASYDAAIALDPLYAMAHNNRANCLRDVHRHPEAMAGYDRAIALEPHNADGYINRGNALGDLRRYDDALADYATAARLRPDFADIQFNMAIIHLQLGQFETAWPLYEARKTRAEPIGNRRFPQPAWTGREEIAGKTLFIHCEQGLGDIMQFYRYARIMVDRGATVIMSVKAPLRRLLEKAHPAIEFVDEDATPATFDFHCALLSLPLALGTALETIPADVPYLWPEWQLRRAWAGRLPPRTRPRIGVVWSGSATYKNDHNRSIAPPIMAPLFELDAHWISLQKELRPGEGDVIDGATRLTFFGDALVDFADTAAIIDLLDLVITVDTSVAHLAGAMGKPVWILLPHNADWRWMLLREDTPWYPSARLFRQQESGNWRSVVTRLQGALRDGLGL